MIKSNDDFDRFYEESVKEVKSIPGLDVKNITGFGNSVVATKKISKGTKFLCKRSSTIDLRKVPKGLDYYWKGDIPYLISGLGFLCNGSSPSYKAISGLSFNAEMDQESRVVTIIKDLNVGDQVILNYGDTYFFFMQGVADPKYLIKGKDYYKQNLNNKNMINQLQDIKELLFDAPKEIKESFNNVVQYFGKSGKGSKKTSEVGEIYFKMHNNPTTVTVAEMDKVNSAEGKARLSDLYKDFKIPNFKSLVYIKGSDPLLDFESNKEFQEAESDGPSRRRVGSKLSIRVFITPKGDKYYALKTPGGNCDYAMPSSLAGKFKVRGGKTSKGKGKM